ncbi:hypothetical protein GALL_188600 [mine drainage metagenome]|uniref:Uncharacterized protein n=1 Tax=mine drainage metagenome TaxID=410659 RepID=A0A1J5SBM5_9ZZZZ
MNIRFVIDTIYGKQNFLKIKETNRGDLILSKRGLHEKLDLSKSILDLQNPDIENRLGENITIHPNLESQSDTITINYKTHKNGQELFREVTSALDVKKELGYSQ